jgi:hypothetical protein
MNIWTCLEALDDKGFERDDLFAFKSKYQMKKFDFSEGAVVQLKAFK